MQQPPLPIKWFQIILSTPYRTKATRIYTIHTTQHHNIQYTTPQSKAIQDNIITLHYYSAHSPLGLLRLHTCVTYLA
jgi:hypothetical protein